MKMQFGDIYLHKQDNFFLMYLGADPNNPNVYFITIAGYLDLESKTQMKIDGAPIHKDYINMDDYKFCEVGKPSQPLLNQFIEMYNKRKMYFTIDPSKLVDIFMDMCRRTGGEARGFLLPYNSAELN